MEQKQQSSEDLRQIMDTAEAIAAANRKYALGLIESDVHYHNEELYISTTKAAKFFHASFHVFSNYYVPAIKKSVRRIVTGRSKYYNLPDMVALMSKAIAQDKSIYELCRIKSKVITNKHGAMKKSKAIKIK